MLSESVDSAEIDPSNRSQPQIYAKFSHLGTRFPKKTEPDTERHASRRKARAPPQENMRVTEGPGSTQEYMCTADTPEL